MSPAPDMTDDAIIINSSTANPNILNIISSSDELDQTNLNALPNGIE